MIYTVTLNPSLDYLVTAEVFVPGRVNRTNTERLLPGGKGINVSLVLAELGVETVALGFLAGFTGEEIQRTLRERGVQTDFLWVGQGFNRINVKLRDASSAEETEINGNGPVMGQKELAGLFAQLEQLSSEDTLVLAGSIPGSLPDTVYQDICEKLSDRGVRLVVDTTGKRLLNVLACHPFLIKPNHHELGELFGLELHRQEDVVPYAKKLQEQGARNVLISMGREGAVLVTEEGQVYQAPAPNPPGRQVKNAVGAGDSMVAGFLAALEGGKSDYREALAMGLCAGSASAFSEELATREEVLELRSQFQF